ncbi:glycosyltransferase family 39 protein [Seohaeicola zhoushanensis]
MTAGGPGAAATDRLPVVVLAVLVCMTAALLLFRLDHPALKMDEVFSVNYIRNGVAYLLDLARPDERNPPGYFLALKAWTALAGDSRAGARSLSVACALACLPLIYLVARPLFGPRVALLAALFLGSFPGFLHYGREARMYAMLFFCLMLAILFCTMLLDHARIRSRARHPALALGLVVTGFAVSLAATFYAHYSAAVYYLCFLAAVVWIFLLERDLRLLGLVGTGLALATLLALPQIFHMLGFVSPGRANGSRRPLRSCSSRRSWAAFPSRPGPSRSSSCFTPPAP